MRSFEVGYCARCGSDAWDERRVVACMFSFPPWWQFSVIARLAHPPSALRVPELVSWSFPLCPVCLPAAYRAYLCAKIRRWSRIVAKAGFVVAGCLFLSFLLTFLFGEMIFRTLAYCFFGSAREFGEVPILRGFPESDEFGLRGRQSLRLQQEVVEVFVPTAAPHE